MNTDQAVVITNHFPKKIYKYQYRLLPSIAFHEEYRTKNYPW
jgi:hypothetical protein